MWDNPLYTKTFFQVMVLLVATSLAVYRFRDAYTHTKLLWASLKTWLFLAPFLFLLFSVENEIFILLLLCLFSIYTCKKFFQMVGMYHRHTFVLVTYFFIGLLFWIIYQEYSEYYNLSPMIFLGCTALIPLLKNDYKNMIQYMGLCLFGFLFFAWAPLHLARIVYFEDGFFLCIFTLIVAEVAEISCLVTGHFVRKGFLFSKISKKITLLGLLVALMASLLASYFLTNILPFRLQDYALSIGFTITLLSLLGDLLITVIRKDLNMKDTGIFILGRGDIIDRMDKLIFVAPFVFYIYQLSIF